MAYPDTTVPQSPFSFLFGAGTNQSYDQLQAKRKRTDLLAAQIMGRQPKTVKEGIGSLLQSAALGIDQYRTDKALGALDDQRDELRKSLIASITGTPYGDPSVSDTSPAAASSTDASKGLAGYSPAAAPPAAGTQVASLGSADPVSDVMAAASGDTKPANWLSYDNQNATRNQPISQQLSSALGFLPDLGVSMKVFSGGQDESGPNRTGSHRHDHGDATDAMFYKDGRQLDWANPDDRPVYEEIVRRAKANGVTGIGAGPGYMSEGSMHIGFGTPSVWGAGGKSANAPDWLKSAYYSKAPNQVASTGNAAAAINAIAPQSGTALSGLAPQSGQSPTDDAMPYIGPQPSADAGMPAQGGSPLGNAPMASIPHVDPGTLLPPLPSSDVGNSPLMAQPQQRAPQGQGQMPTQLAQGGLSGQGSPMPAAPRASFDPRWVQLYTDPGATAQDRALAGMMIQRFQDASDPAKQLDADFKRAQIEALHAKANGTGNGNEFYGNTLPFYDAQGNLHYGQLSKNGTMKDLSIGDGAKFAPPVKMFDTGTQGVAVGPGAHELGRIDKQNQAEAQEKATGTAIGTGTGQAVVALPAAQQTAGMVAAQIDDLKNDPYLPSMLGSLNSRLPNLTSDAARVQGKMNQLQGGAFLQARQMLKGGGAITDFEGSKAEAAYARLNAAQNVDDYNKALDDFNEAVQLGLRKLQQQAGSQSPAQPQGQLQAPPAGEGTTKIRKFNPETGAIE